MRLVALAAVGLAVLATGVAALASGSPSTWQELAARVNFPVYQPTVTLGFKLTLDDGVSRCGYGGIETIGARYNKGSGRQAPVIGFREAYPRICGNDGESVTVGSVDVNGVKVRLHVYCYSPGPKCTLKDGFTHGFALYLQQPGRKRTWIQTSSRYVSLDDFLKVVRSLTSVVPKPHAEPPVISPPTSTEPAVSGRCSKTTALQVATQFHVVVDPSLLNPVGQVLCGTFVGPGSQAMVVSLSSGSCQPTAGWVVFRLAGGTWQLVLRRDNGADLAAVGPDIRETVWVVRPNDSPCFPTGGTRARIWHWNGTHFTASTWKQVTKG